MPSEWAKTVGDPRACSHADSRARPRERRQPDQGHGHRLSAHKQETFTAEDESRLLTLQLEKSRRRQGGDKAKVYYRFKLLGNEPLPVEDVPRAAVAESARRR